MIEKDTAIPVICLYFDEVFEFVLYILVYANHRNMA